MSNQQTLEKFGLRIKELRLKKGLSQTRLAIACKLDNSKISKIEAGKVNITMLTLLNISAALEIEPMELLNIGHFKETLN